MTVSVQLTTDADPVARDEKGNVISTAHSPSTPQPKKLDFPPQRQYFLQDWPNDDIPTLCEYTLNALRGFVETLRKNYP